MNSGGSVASTDSGALSQFVLGLGDDVLILAQRMCEWVAWAPELEEDMALANIGLDLLGQARALLSYAGETEGAGRSEDDLAFLRDEREFRNLQITELPNGDFAVSMVRLLLFASYVHLMYRDLSRSTDPTLAGIAAKAEREAAYHVDHARSWVIRLGDGTEESHERTEIALASLWPFVPEMFFPVSEFAELVKRGAAIDPRALSDEWYAGIRATLAAATLAEPDTTWIAEGGRNGIHSEHLGHLLPELQHVHRAHPGATW